MANVYPGKYFCSVMIMNISLLVHYQNKRFIELNMNTILISNWTQFRCGEDLEKTNCTIETYFFFLFSKKIVARVEISILIIYGYLTMNTSLIFCY